MDVVAIIVAPPFNKEAPADACAFPVCFINGNLELPAPHVISRAAGPAAEAPNGLIVFESSITSTMLTMFWSSILTIVLLFVMTRGRSMLPGKAQNAIEHVWELIEGFGMSLGGPAAQALHPAVRGLLPVHPVQQLERPASRRSARSRSSAPQRAT